MRNEIFDTQQFKDNLKNYELAVGKGKHIFLDAFDLIDLAEYYQQNSQDDKAKEVGKYALTLYPENDSVLLLNAHIALNIDGDFDYAKQIFDNVANKDDVEYRITFSDYLLHIGEVDKAAEYLETALETIDEEEKQLFILDVTELFLNHEYFLQAEYWLNRHNGDGNYYKELRARVEFETGNLDECERLIKELLDDLPYDDYLWRKLAVTQYLQKKYNETLNSCEFAIAISPTNNEAIRVKAYTLFALDNYSEAIQYFKKHLENMPDDIISQQDIATCYIQTSQPNLAIPHLLYILENTDNQDFYHNGIYRSLAFAYSGINEIEKAIEAIDNINIAEKDSPYIDMIKGHIYLENNLKEEAVHHYENAIINSAESPKVLIDIALSLSDNGYVESAYKIANFYRTRTKPEDEKINTIMAYLSFRIGKKGEFIEYLKKALEGDQDFTKTILSCIFPQGLPPEEYVEYAKKIELKPDKTKD